MQNFHNEVHEILPVRFRAFRPTRTHAHTHSMPIPSVEEYERKQKKTI